MPAVIRKTCFLMSCCLVGATVLAQSTPSPLDDLVQLPALALKDTRQVFAAPSRWDSQDWAIAGLGTAGFLGAAFLVDSRLDRRTREHPGDSLKGLEPLGGAGSLLIVGGAYLGGSVFGQDALKSYGTDAGLSMVVAELGIVLPLKYLTGRSRPKANQGSGHFSPFGGDVSFPSTHTTQAFILASVLSEHTDNPWVSAGAYGVASLVGLSRIQQREHFFSDVLAGAAIGTFVGRTVTAYNRTLRSKGTLANLDLSFTPVLAPGYQGGMVHLRF